jgi:uncharacterized phage protein (TIGR01671 family)
MSVREIKFRAWDKLGKRMGNVNYIKYSDVKYTHISVRFKQKEKNIDDWFNYGGKDGCDNIILMQFTGLYDKDGKEIYEGDIVKAKDPHRFQDGRQIFYTCEVVYTDNAMFMLKNNYDNYGKAETRYFDLKIMELEVIGNIYENPELLKE